MIDIAALRKSFPSRHGTVEAVRGVDLAAGPGEVIGLLGTNGAGKTTTLRMLATLIPPDAGRAVIGGADLLTEPAKVRATIGYVLQGGSSWPTATGQEELVLQARMHGFSKAEAVRRAGQLAETFELTEFADRRCGTYSGGERRRLEIALGLVHEPRVLFLDEPTIGLDPVSRARVWTEIRRLRDAGMTAILTTHYLDEADALCDRVSIMDHGEIVAHGTPQDLKREIRGDLVSVGVNGDAAHAGTLLAGQDYVHEVEVQAEGLRLNVDQGATAIPRIVAVLERGGVALTSIEVHRPTLDDVFLTKTGRPLAGEPAAGPAAAPTPAAGGPTR